jgi:hypothetical protein
MMVEGRVRRPRAKCRASIGRGPSHRASGDLDLVLLGAALAGLVMSRRESPSSVRRSSPSVWTSSRPTGLIPRRSTPAGDPGPCRGSFGSETAVTYPRGLLRGCRSSDPRDDERASDPGARRPWSVRRSPSFATRPLTKTGLPDPFLRPRRDPSPPAARSLHFRPLPGRGG